MAEYLDIIRQTEETEDCSNCGGPGIHTETQPDEWICINCGAAWRTEEKTMIEIPKQLLRDVKSGPQWALEKLPDECDCPEEVTYMEHDTGALIHDEENCVVILRGHIEVVLEKLTEAMAAFGDLRS